MVLITVALTLTFVGGSMADVLVFGFHDHFAAVGGAGFERDDGTGVWRASAHHCDLSASPAEVTRTSDVSTPALAVPHDSDPTGELPPRTLPLPLLPPRA